MKSQKRKVTYNFREQPTVLISPGRGGGGSIASKVTSLGADCFIVHPGEVDYIEDLLNLATHVIIGGGTDIAPRLYGLDFNANCQTPDHERDLLEWSLLELAEYHGKPVMGICRGHQIMCAWTGAQLFRDVQAEQGTKFAHVGPRHPIKVVNKSELWRATKGKRIITNSLHHQAVNPATAPNNLHITATAPDGVVEAAERTDLAWVGIQSHPELMYDRWTWSFFLNFLLYRAA